MACVIAFNLRSTVDKIASGESGAIEESHNTYTYDQLMSPTFKLVMPLISAMYGTEISWCLDRQKIRRSVIHE